MKYITFNSKLQAIAEHFKTAPGADRFAHGEKVYISYFLEVIPGLTKADLIAFHRSGLIKLSRADLPDMCDLEKIKASETRYENAEWHFVRAVC